MNRLGEEIGKNQDIVTLTHQRPGFPPDTSWHEYTHPSAVSLLLTHTTHSYGRNRWPFKITEDFVPVSGSGRDPITPIKDTDAKKSFIFGGTFSDRTHCVLTYWRWESALVLHVGFPQVGYNTNRSHTRQWNLYSQSLLDILSTWPKWEMLQSSILWCRHGKIHG